MTRAVGAGLAGEPIGASGLLAPGATVAELAAAMARRELTAVGLTAFYLDRIERLNPELHAVIAVNPGALAEAEAADRAREERRHADPSGPLHGIPVLIKDNIGTATAPATAGSPALLGAQPREAFCVRRLRAAGAVILGRANLSEWANFRSEHSSSGWSTLGGQAVNPHGAGRSPSGSSSGSAVAVAAGLAPLAVGTETDGSIVSPASACGITGVKPTLGLVSRAGIVPISLAQDTAGPMAGCVADAAALLSAMAGQDPADPATSGAAGQPADYTAFLGPGALEGARLGVWREGLGRATPATLAVLEEAVARMREAGAQIIDPVELAGANKIGDPEFFALTCEFRRDLGAYLASLAGEHPSTLGGLIEFNEQNASTVLSLFGQDLFERAEATAGPEAGRAEGLAPAAVAARAQATALARAALDGALDGHRLDAVVSLTTGPAWLIDHVLGDPVVSGTSSPAAVAGYPAVSVLSGYVDNLPVNLSFMGRAWSEPRLLALAGAFEQACHR
jgi:amidase